MAIASTEVPCGLSDVEFLTNETQSARSDDAASDERADTDEHEGGYQVPHRSSQRPRI